MSHNETVEFVPIRDDGSSIEEILSIVLSALEEKGYNPLNQLIGYILAGDPTYITGHKNARQLIRQIDRDELLEEVLKFYIKEKNIEI